MSADHKNDTLFGKVISSFAGPVQSLSDSHNFLTNKLHVTNNELFDASAFNFSSAFALTILGLYFKSSFTEQWMGVYKEVSDGNIPQNYISEALGCAAFGGLMKASEFGVDYFEGRAAANIKALAHRNFKPSEKVDSELKTQSVHNLNKLIDHGTHYIFETLTSLYTFASGLSGIYNLGVVSYAPAFIGASIACNLVAEQLIHSNLHTAKENYHDVNKYLQNKINKEEDVSDSDVAKFKDLAQDASLWESIQDKMHHYVESYLTPTMQILFCAVASNNGLDKDNIPKLWDSLENLSSPFIHHLEHGDDVTDDHVYREALEKVLVSSDGDDVTDDHANREALEKVLVSSEIVQEAA